MWIKEDLIARCGTLSRIVFSPILFFPKLHSSPFFFSILPRLVTDFFLFFLVPHQASSHLPFAHHSLTSLSSTPLHYEVQLRITPPKIIFILIDSFGFQKLNITIYLFMCLTHVACCTKTCIACVGPWWIKGGGDDFFLSPNCFSQSTTA